MINIEWIELRPEDPGVLVKLPERLEVPEACTVPQALQALGYTQRQILDMLEKKAVAVFGLYATEQTVLHENDRLEILDGLNFDPMESRRRRAQHKADAKARERALAGGKPARRSTPRRPID